MRGRSRGDGGRLRGGRIAELLDSPSYHENGVSMFVHHMRHHCVSGEYEPSNAFARRAQHGGKFLDQMWSVACLLQLFNHTGDNLIVDPLRINLCIGGRTRGRWWRMFVGRSCSQLGLFRERSGRA